MHFYSLNGGAPPVDFREATLRGLAPDKGLYFPERVPLLEKSFWDNIETIPDEEIAFRIIQPYVGSSIPPEGLSAIIAETLAFPLPLKTVTDNVSVLELFHGPTLAFKDIGARFMSRCLAHFASAQKKKTTVLVATSGDTGSAVAHGFHRVEGVDVVILFPSGRVSSVQEKQLTTLGDNILTLEVGGNFDDCQRLVKEAFNDPDLRARLHLTSANSINIARWLPQQFYYLIAWKQWPRKGVPTALSVPSGNFGNLAAALLAQRSGLPFTRFIAACNANDVIPNYLKTGTLREQAVIPTLSNAMDIALPSNFIRMEALYDNNLPQLQTVLEAVSITDIETRKEIRELFTNHNYVADPHTAVAFAALKKSIRKGESGIVVSTAHPVKFPEVVEAETGLRLPLPPAIHGLLHKPSAASKMQPHFNELKEFLLGLS